MTKVHELKWYYWNPLLAITHVMTAGTFLLIGNYMGVTRGASDTAKAREYIAAVYKCPTSGFMSDGVFYPLTKDGYDAAIKEK